MLLLNTRMKQCATFCLSALLMTGILASCANPEHQVDSGSRFHEAATADVVLRHYQWDHINIIQPEHREQGFLIQHSGGTLGPAFDRLLSRRELAVVVLGWSYAPGQLEQLVTDWNHLLRRHGFKRVVCLRAGAGNRIDGLLIIDDTRQAHDTPKQTAGF